MHTAIQASQPEAFQLLMSSATAEHLAMLEEVNRLAISRTEAARSRAIEQQGGYSFANNLVVPTSFNFGGSH